MSANQVDVSVIVACYNPNLERLRKTLISILNQTGCVFEIIIADDGSKEEYYDYVKRICSVYANSIIKFSIQKKNRGTVCNIFEAIKISKGKYIKTISPGDYLYDEHTLSDMLAFFSSNSVKVGFSDAIYYCNLGENEYKVVSRQADPRFPFLYDINNYNIAIAKNDNLVFDTYILGASLFFERQLLYKYLSLFIGKVKFAEDFILKIIIADNIPVIHYPKITVWYECNDGISNSTNSIWMDRLDKDYKAAYRILYKRLKNDCFGRRLRICLKYRNKLLTKRVTTLVLFPGASMRWLLLKNKKCYSQDNNINYSFLNRIMEN